MWYVPCSTTETQYEDINQIPPALKQYYEYFMLSTPVLNTLYNDIGYTRIYTGFRYDAVDPPSIWGTYPLEKDYNLFLNYTGVTEVNSNFFL